MITYRDGDLFASPARVLVNPTNCVGPMGAGLAKQFARRFPGLEAWYRALCRDGSVRIGTLWPYAVAPDLVVLNFPTKRHWSQPAHIDYVVSGLEEYVATCTDLGPSAFPALGCGLGDLLWPEVKLVLERYLDPLDFSVEVYRPLAARGS